MKSATRINPLIRLPPPLLFASTFLAGVGLQYLEPMKVPATRLVEDVHLLGMGLVAAGLIIAVTCIRMFIRAHTTLIPFGSATTLLTHGPYRYSRNPIYLSMVITYLGVVAMLAQLWSLLLLPIPVAVIHTVVIPGEEARLREIFGAAFKDYSAQVRRWL